MMNLIFIMTFLFGQWYFELLKYATHYMKILENYNNPTQWVTSQAIMDLYSKNIYLHFTAGMHMHFKLHVHVIKEKGK